MRVEGILWMDPDRNRTEWKRGKVRDEWTSRRFFDQREKSNFCSLLFLNRISLAFSDSESERWTEKSEDVEENHKFLSDHHKISELHTIIFCTDDNNEESIQYFCHPRIISRSTNSFYSLCKRIIMMTMCVMIHLMMHPLSVFQELFSPSVPSWWSQSCSSFSSCCSSSHRFNFKTTTTRVHFPTPTGKRDPNNIWIWRCNCYSFWSPPSPVVYFFFFSRFPWRSQEHLSYSSSWSLLFFSKIQSKWNKSRMEMFQVPLSEE